jgi:hypothetical protein
MKRILLMVALVTMVCGLAGAADTVPFVSKFEACENRGGAGFFWVDTTSGKTWWQNPSEMKWEYVGAPKGSGSAPMGTYRPFENHSGQGVFILNTATGEGWWTNGKQWKALGKPRERQ